jgi:hypothetical protein
MTKAIVLEKPFIIKPYSNKELSGLMNVSVHVLTTWIKSMGKEIGKPIAGVYSINQVKLIVETFGIPGQIVNETL